MKLSCGKRQSPISAQFVCHRGSLCNLSRRTRRRRGFNERPIIPLTWPGPNLLTVPYVTVPLLISLVVCLCCMSAASRTSQLAASLNWSSHEFGPFKCTFIRPNVGLSVCAFFYVAHRCQARSAAKLACHALAMVTLTTLLIAANVRPVTAQSSVFLNAGSMDSYEHEDEEDNEQTAYPTIVRLQNDTVSLPCNISQTKEEENSIKLILWYKNNILGTPIYSIDARDTNISQARHFVAPPYQGRATFELNIAQRLALLVVNPIVEEDDASFICRVDFRWTRTTISTVKLDVIVPPQRLRVIQLHQSATLNAASNGSHSGGDGNWAKPSGSPGTRQWNNGVEMHGRPHQHPVPLQASVLSIVHNGSMINEIETVRQPEETELTLLCDSIGGRPRSIVKWYRLRQWENQTTRAEQLYAELQSTEESALQLIDDSFYHLNRSEPEIGLAEMATDWKMGHNRAATFTAPVTNGDESQSTAFVRNELHLGTVENFNHGQLYLCRTSNSNLSKPLDLIVRLEIYTRPKSIQIQQKLPPKDLLLPPSLANTNSPPLEWPRLAEPSKGSSGNSHADGHLVRNRTLHSIELLDYYLNAKQSLIRQPFRLRSGFETEFICQSSGSRPAARIVWLLRDFRTAVQKDLTQLSSSYFNGHDTLSLLRFVPKYTDNRASLICRACNEALSEVGACLPTDGSISSNPRNGGHHRVDHYGASNKSQMTPPPLDESFQLEASVLLEVNYKPIVSVIILSGEQMYHEVAQPKARQQKQKMGETKAAPSRAAVAEGIAPSSNHHQFVEMQEVFFNCSINANPQVHLVHWFFNGKALHTDLSKGIIITNSNRTMIISSASRSNAGYFHCAATNLLGETESERHQIEVLFEPQCQVDYIQTSYHQLGDIVQLKCQVLANPVSDLQFTWQFNGTKLAGHHANRSTASQGHFVDEEEEGGHNNGSGDHKKTTASKLAEAGDKSRHKANLPQPSRTATHSSSQQAHLITNVVRIELNKWSSFGHFSCQASNSVGQQKKACTWHVAPYHYQPRQDGDAGKHLSGVGRGETGPAHHHHYRHHQQQMSASHHPHFAGASSAILNNCQIIESSNAVVIKCLEADENEGSEDYLATGQQRQSPKTIDRASASVPSISHDSAEFSRVNHAEIPTRLTYHVQVYQLTEAFAKLNSSAKADSNSKSLPQIDQPEPGKRVASKPSSSQASQADMPEPVLLMDTINFTNPLFIITNLSASTNYLLKISKAHLGATLEQVNITVRTRPNDDLYGPTLPHNGQNSGSLASLLQVGSQKLVLLVALVAFICAVFVALILISAVYRIRAILDVRKARRAVNVNESISALETALCEMRPEKLENDLKSKSHFSIDSYRPYISVDDMADDCMVAPSTTNKAESCTSPLNRQFADSSFITYPNYLYPSMPSSTIVHKNGLKLNCSDEESVSTSNTSASNRTNTTESTNANSNFTTESNKDQLELSFDKRCFPPPVTLDSNMLFCMDSELAPSSSSSHAYLVPESYHPYPMRLHILPEAEELDSGLAQSVTVVSTPSGEKCSYLPPMDTTTVLDLSRPLSGADAGQGESIQKSIQTAV